MFVSTWAAPFGLGGRRSAPAARLEVRSGLWLLEGQFPGPSESREPSGMTHAVRPELGRTLRNRHRIAARNASALTRDDGIHPFLPDQRIEPRHPRAEEHVGLLLERRPRRLEVGTAP